MLTKREWDAIVCALVTQAAIEDDKPKSEFLLALATKISRQQLPVPDRPG